MAPGAGTKVFLFHYEILSDYYFFPVKTSSPITGYDVFCTDLHRGLKKTDSMTQKALKDCFEFLMKLYKDFKDDFLFN